MKSDDNTIVVAAVLVAFMENRPSWKGTATELHNELTKFKNDYVNEENIVKAFLKLKYANDPR